MEFFDFQLRAWKVDDSHVQVMVHSSPAGDMQKPVKVVFHEGSLDLPSRWFMASAQAAITTGRKLSAVLLPRPVLALLTRSLELIGSDNGLRLRLCLDESLVDFPWEYLYRPDVPGEDSLVGFLVLDSRISIVRGAPTTVQTLEVSEQAQRLVFAGMLQGGESDRQEVRKEFQELSKSLEPVAHLLQPEFVTGGEGQIETALLKPASIFHFSGYTSVENRKGFLVREIDPPTYPSVPRLYSETISDLLKKARTRLAFFNANDSSQWAFMEPLVRADIPALIGMYRATSVPEAIAFAQKLYSSLATGLSLDEAITWARLHLLEANLGDAWSCPWGQFVVYMPTTRPVLLPRPSHKAILQSQESARQEREQTITAANQSIGRVPGGQAPIDKRSLRQAMVRAFNLGELKVLCADVEQNLEDDGIKLQVSLEMVGGEDGLEFKILDLVDYLDRRSYLAYLVDAVRRARPAIS